MACYCCLYLADVRTALRMLKFTHLCVYTCSSKFTILRQPVTSPVETLVTIKPNKCSGIYYTKLKTRINQLDASWNITRFLYRFSFFWMLRIANKKIKRELKLFIYEHYSPCHSRSEFASELRA